MFNLGLASPEGQLFKSEFWNGSILAGILGITKRIYIKIKKLQQYAADWLGCPRKTTRRSSKSFSKKLHGTAYRGSSALTYLEIRSMVNYLVSWTAETRIIGSRQVDARYNREKFPLVENHNNILEELMSWLGITSLSEQEVKDISIKWGSKRIRNQFPRPADEWTRVTAL